MMLSSLTYTRASPCKRHPPVARPIPGNGGVTAVVATGAVGASGAPGVQGVQGAPGNGDVIVPPAIPAVVEFTGGPYAMPNFTTPLYFALIPFFHNPSTTTDASVALTDPSTPPANVTSLAYTTHFDTTRIVTAMRLAFSVHGSYGIMSNRMVTVSAQLVRIVPPSTTVTLTGLTVSGTAPSLLPSSPPALVFSTTASPASPVSFAPGELMGVFITISDVPTAFQLTVYVDKVVVTLDVEEP